MGKRKGAWRKAKIEDVEETLEDERLVRQLKKKNTSKQESAEIQELFHVDTVGSCQGLSAQTRRELARARLFPAKGPNLGLSASEEAKVERCVRHLERAKAPGEGFESASQGQLFDAWAGALPAELLRAEKDGSTVRRSWASFTPQSAASAKKARVSRDLTAPALLRPQKLNERPSTAPAVLPPHEGQGLNPTAEAYEELACLAAAQQLERERAKEALERQMRPVTHQLVDALGKEALRDMDEEAKVRAFQELRGGASVPLNPEPDEQSDGQEEGDSGQLRSQAVASSKRLKQKSQAQRNRERYRKHADVRQKQLLAQRRLAKSVGSIREVVRELDEQERVEKERKEYKKAVKETQTELESKEGRLGRVRRVGRLKISDAPILVPEEGSTGSGLRLMKKQGSALKEQLSSFIRRRLTTPLPEASKSEVEKRKYALRKQKKRKLISPLQRENLMLS